MSEIVNLRRARKQKARATREEKAAANRIRFGAPKQARSRAKAISTLEEKTFAGHRLTDEPPDKD